MAMKRKRSTKTYTKRKRARTGSKNLRKIVKSIVVKNAETKTAYQSGAGYQLYSNDGGKAHNVEYYISQGTGDTQRIGDEIHLKAVKMKIRWVSPSISDVNNAGVQRGSPVHVRLSLIKSRVRDTTGATNWWVTTNIIGSKKASALPYYMQSWDSEKCKVLRSVTKRATYDATLAADGYIEMYVPINQKIRYDADNSGYGRFTNHYWVIEYFQQGQGALSTAPFAFDSEFAIYFKDL